MTLRLEHARQQYATLDRSGSAPDWLGHSNIWMPRSIRVPRLHPWETAQLCLFSTTEKPDRGVWGAGRAPGQRRLQSDREDWRQTPRSFPDALWPVLRWRELPRAGRRFFGVGFHQVNAGFWNFRQRAGYGQARKPSARTKVGPNAGLWRKRDQLQRVRDMTGPEISLCRRCDQIDLALPAQEHSDEAIQAIHCFT